MCFLCSGGENDLQATEGCPVFICQRLPTVNGDHVNEISDCEIVQTQPMSPWVERAVSSSVNVGSVCLLAGLRNKKKYWMFLIIWSSFFFFNKRHGGLGFGPWKTNYILLLLGMRWMWVFRRGLADFNKCWASDEGCVILSDI